MKKKLILKKTIESDLLDYAELLNYLKETDLLILERIIRKVSKYQFDKEILDYYREQLAKHMFEQKEINREIITRYAGEEYISDDYYMELNFREKELSIYEN